MLKQEARERLSPMRGEGGERRSTTPVAKKTSAERGGGGGGGSRAAAANKKMERGISKASENELIVVQARSSVESHFQHRNGNHHRGAEDSPDCNSGRFVSSSSSSSNSSNSSSSSSGSSSCVVAIPVGAPGSASPNGFVDTPVYTFTLPDLTSYPGKARRLRERDRLATNLQEDLPPN